MIPRRLGKFASSSRIAEKTARTATSTVPDELKKLRAMPAVKDCRVIIVGAGAAGLCAAVELESLGCDVKLLEADPSHVGGRVRTLRFSQDRYAEAGAMRIPTDHLLTRHYIHETGLKLRKFVFENKDAYFHIRGQRVRVSDKKDLQALFHLTPVEKCLGDDGIWEKEVLGLLSSLSEDEKADLYAATPTTERVRSVDAQSLWQLLAKSNSSEAVQMIGSLWNLETSMHIGLTEHLREEEEGTWVNGFDEIVGGTDRLMTELSKRLSSPILTSHEVFAIEHNSKRVSVYANTPDGQQCFEGDWVICTLPLGVMSRVRVTPSFSNRKRDAIRRIHYDDSTKILALTKNRFWELDDGIYGGGSTSDGLLGSTWYPSDNLTKEPVVSKSPSVFLASYTWGQQARRMAIRSTWDETEAELAKLHDSLKSQPELIERTVTWSWGNYKWSSGAYAFFRPGEHTELYKALIEPEGRVVLAGEHASLTHSWIQGAFESAVRACTICIQ
ncbi:NAD(P)/FAD-dependent oxidoreductase [Gimesia sp.]|uniref:flavin monoamine oxidase family protein n=1 Tax=Gimesia sp. TaxID=2024833 RepID=UPI0025C56CF4|nr:NAD(P)/FAD-dependent oxidoreductase [Gimesia sp.]|tara:strand:+ start:3246 stop:4745 length:1500 start_codon:yes stop_codon:yes gene_type:complete